MPVSSTDCQADNPLLHMPQTPYGALPLSSVTIDHIREAVEEGVRLNWQEIEAITGNPEPPTFDNTVLALENSGDVLERALTVMGYLLANKHTDELEALAQQMTPLINDHYNKIQFCRPLFDRVRQVKRSAHGLCADDKMLLDDTYTSFRRRGIALPRRKQERLQAISQELSLLSLEYSQNVLAETNAFSLLITDEADLRGLPEQHRAIARQAAADKGQEGWLFTLQQPSMGPLLTYLDNRELRRKVWMAWNRVACTRGRHDNRHIVIRIANLRREYAAILGYDTYSSFVTERRMARTPERVNAFLDELIDCYKPKYLRERRAVRAYVRRLTGRDFKIKPWDSGYYNHKYRIEQLHFDPEQLRPYLELGAVKNGIFRLAATLYGISMERVDCVPVIYDDVEVYDVKDADGISLGLLYLDYHPREDKQGGAWTCTLRDQYVDSQGVDHRPHVSITMNLTRPAADMPALLTLGETSTFLHEFGHALHCLFSRCRHASQSGTSVMWDFVELPSQLMENYAGEPAFLHTFARHYQTGEPLPDELIDGVRRSRNFQVASSCIRQVSLSLIDMALHNTTTDLADDLFTIENETMHRVYPKARRKGCTATNFSHIMAGGYASGYYSYKWAEVLDADAFELFKEKGIFSREVAGSFRRNILERGGTDDPNRLYRRFRHRKPSVKALLRRDGLDGDNKTTKKPQRQ